MLNKAAKDLTLIIYDSPAPPRQIKLSKITLKLFFIASSILIITSIGVTAYILANLQRIENQSISKQPKLINDFKLQIAELKLSLEQKDNFIKEQERKISDGARSLGIPANIFQTPLGFTDRTDQNPAQIEDVKFEHKDNVSTLNFNLLNVNEEGQKLSGYIFIMQIGVSQVKFYPELNLNSGEFFFKYNMGEAFTASRFRPVMAKFTNYGQEELQYKVFIFSRTGDLLLEQLIGPFNSNE
jgi:hypothetical protein